MSKPMPTVSLRHGAQLPVIGLGTWPMSDDEATRAVAEALAAGYRAVDTAEAYGNERGVGRGIRASGVPRDEVFVTTKFNRRWHGRELAVQAFERSAEALGVDYVDLLLIHWPNPGQDRYLEAWRGLVDLLEAGRVRAVGTSNFKPSHLRRIVDATGVVPDLNQIELCPLLTRDAARAFHDELGIVTQAWSPFGGDGVEVLHNPVVRGVAAECGRTPAQVVLRWVVQQGMVTIPKSADPQRMRENLRVFDFELTPDQLATLSALDQGEEAAVDSDRSGH